ncbi:hypothetical protein BC937DRAFT_88676 [Endogone sp. FLAS-F59071]|nr:hypothetical protein BC937DRAFT_88676 [Endogone sp. FLAS-F59071]|eukprot:RUS18512.1 hypothetical protein BC937DRAFT_88676 [Endogone sp. FLAS-F59071]
MTIIADEEYRGSRQPYRLENDDLVVDPRFTSIFVENLASGEGFVLIDQVSRDDPAVDEEQASDKSQETRLTLDRIRISIRVYANEGALGGIRITPSITENTFRVVVDNREEIWTLRNTIALFNQPLVEITVHIPTLVDHMEKMTVVTQNQEIDIDNLEGILFTDSFHATSTNGKISAKHLRGVNISLNTTSGELVIPGIISAGSSLSVKTVSGKMEIHQQPDRCNGSTSSTVHLETTSGSIRGEYIAREKLTAKSVNGLLDFCLKAPDSGERPSVQVSSISGSMKGKLTIGKIFEANTTGGSVNFTLDNGGETVMKASSISGNVELSLLNQFKGKFKLSSITGKTTVTTPNEDNLKWEKSNRNYKQGFKEDASVAENDEEVKELDKSSVSVTSTSGNIALNFEG